MQSKYLIYILLSFIFLNGCKNKHICPECEVNKVLMIEFDWKDVDQIPEGMRVLFYNDKGDLAYSFNVSSAGERIWVKSGVYTVFCHNNDTEYVNWRGQSHENTLEAYTRNGTIEEDHTRATSSEDEQIVVQPDFLCGDVRRNVLIPIHFEGVRVILLTPQDLLDHYTYEISNIVNLKAVTKIRCTLTGISGTLFPCKPENQLTPTTIPFMGNVSVDNKGMVEGEMQNFGYIKNSDVKNYLTTYLWRPGGNVKATYDVTDQLRNAPDPRNVNIVIHTTITIPDEIGNDDEGLDPTVEDWIDIEDTIIL